MALFQKFQKLQATGEQTASEHMYLTQFQQQMQAVNVNNFHGTCMRFLFSRRSGVFCFHIFNLNPFASIALPSAVQGGL